MSELTGRDEALVRDYMRRRGTVSPPSDLLRSALWAAAGSPSADEWRRAPAALGAMLAASVMLVAVVIIGRTLPPSESPAPVVPVEPLLLVTQAGDELGIQPADPISLEPRVGRAPIALGHHYNWAVSADLRTLVVIGWPADRPPDFVPGTLHFVDLADWTADEPGAVIDMPASALMVSRDGSTAWWIQPKGLLPATQATPWIGIPRGPYVLRALERGAEQPTTVSQLPDGLRVMAVRLTADGERVAIVALPVDGSAAALAQGPPVVLVVELASGSIVRQFELAGVRAGQWVEGTGGRDLRYVSADPGLAWDDRGGLLYVVHDEGRRVTVAGVNSGAVRDMEIRGRQSLVEAMLSWVAPAARAKMVPGTDLRAALSPDGQRLYVTGVRRAELRDDSGRVIGWDEIPLGLRVISTADGSEIARTELSVDQLALSPDGTTLLLTGTEIRVRNNQPGVTKSSGLYILDADTLERRFYAASRDDLLVRPISYDGRHCYVMAHHWVDDPLDPAGSPDAEWRLRVIDLATGATVAEKVAHGYAELLPLGGASLGQ